VEIKERDTRTVSYEGSTQGNYKLYSLDLSSNRCVLGSNVAYMSD